MKGHGYGILPLGISQDYLDTLDVISFWPDSENKIRILVEDKELCTTKYQTFLGLGGNVFSTKQGLFDFLKRIEE